MSRLAAANPALAVLNPDTGVYTEPVRNIWVTRGYSISMMFDFTGSAHE